MIFHFEQLNLVFVQACSTDSKERGRRERGGIVSEKDREKEGEGER